MEINKTKVKKLLDEVGDSFTDEEVKELSNEDGTLDLRRFNELPRVVKVKNRLHEMGVTRKYLIRYFNNAGMIFTMRS